MESNRTSGKRFRTIWLAALLGAVLWAFLVTPPLHQSEAYHNFADRRTILGIPNFWNVISNISFVLVAGIGFCSLHCREAFLERWERSAYGLAIVGVAMTAVGSGHYHLNPNSQTLFWDRLPMTIVFMSILALTIGDRISMRVGYQLLVPLLALGVSSALDWRFSGDLRPYALVQFAPMLAVPVMLIFFPSRYTNSWGVWWMAGLYVLAKGAELFDHQIAGIIPTGGHPWKHLISAAGIGCYAVSIMRRKAQVYASTAPVDLKTA
jgi:hypothetical protein